MSDVKRPEIKPAAKRVEEELKGGVRLSTKMHGKSEQNDAPVTASLRRRRAHRRATPHPAANRSSIRPRTRNARYSSRSGR